MYLNGHWKIVYVRIMYIVLRKRVHIKYKIFTHMSSMYIYPKGVNLRQCDNNNKKVNLYFKRYFIGYCNVNN